MAARLASGVPGRSPHGRDPPAAFPARTGHLHPAGAGEIRMNQSTSLMRPDDGFLVPEGSYPVEPRLLPDPRMLMHIARRNLRLFLIVFSLVWIAIIAWLAVT